MNNNYSPKQVEQKWQAKWKKLDCFKTNLQQNDRNKNCYILEMLPYPSGKVHMGHVRNYTIGDVIARYKRSLGYNVLYPMGWDAFGLPAENAAKENNIHPKVWTINNINDMKTQLLSLGFSWDWSREITTNDPDFTKVEQEIFIDLFNHGIAYRKKAWVNWDPIENTVLANEQIIDGKGWRSGATIEQKELSQWFLKITDFAEDLLDDLKLLKKWPENVKNMQSSWIGKSDGAIINFNIKDNKDYIQVYTTKPHTIFGASFIGLSVKHPLSLKLAEAKLEIKNFIDKYKDIKNLEEELKNTAKEGILTNLTAINPVNQTEIPIYITNYVLDYATNSIFGCPAHNQQDFDFAKQYNVPIKIVIQPIQSQSSAQKHDFSSSAYEGEGRLINSDFLNELNSDGAKTCIINYIIDNNIGKQHTQFRIKDWGVSRQRYWGTPIPIIYCEKCGIVPEKKENLPILLPEDVDFNTNVNPLDIHKTFKYCKCSKCNSNAIRETDTFDTFMESSWYYIKYITSNTTKNTFDKNLLKSFLPVDQYIGGIEHAIMHLLYSRFIFKALIKMNYIDNNFNEPFYALLTQGMITHKTYQTIKSKKWIFPNKLYHDNTGILRDSDTNEEVIEGKVEKMSKSKKNIVDPAIMCSIYGADSIRMFVLSDSPPDKWLEWNEEGLEGIYKFINRIWKFYNKLHNEVKNVTIETIIPKHLTSTELNFYIKIQQYIFNISNYTNNNHFNKTISLLRELFNLINDNYDTINNNLLYYASNIWLILANPIIPHLTEELWELLNNSNILAKQSFPIYDKDYLHLDKVTIGIQIKGKTKGNIEIDIYMDEQDILKEIKKISSINKHLHNKEIKKIIYVPKKIINIII